jgi:hypothetical protein
MLLRAMQNRNITITRDYDQDCECVLLNGASLARTFLDLIAAAVRTVADGGQIELAVTGMEPSHILVQIRHNAVSGELFGVPRNSTEGEVPILIESHPQFILALRTIQSCGGKLLLKYEDATHRAFSIILPRNPLRAVRTTEAST